MAINPIHIAAEIEARFRRYLLTTFDFPQEHADLRSQFRAALLRPECLFRGPYLHGLAPYVRDTTVADLVTRKVLPRAVADLPLLSPNDRPLYRHQVRAIERLRAGHNAIVSSGTGSGKTLTFLAPILASILEDPRPGVHALLLYPMNALVNDQLKNLRRVLRDVPRVRFGRYINVQVTPEDEKQGRRLHPQAPKNEVVSREVFRKDPPHLLVTNYAMLEYLLLRVDDSPLFQGPWRFIVVDEAHTYAGAKGSEVALLLRRLQCRVKGPGEQPAQCIATSATLGAGDADRRREVLDFARGLFNAPFADDDLILAEKQHTPAEGGCEPEPSIYDDPALQAVCEPGARWSAAVDTALSKAGFSAATVAAAAAAGAASVEEGLYQAFRTDVRVLRLREVAGEPRDLGSAATLVLGSQDAVAVERLCGLVRLCSLARVPRGDARLVPCRYHFFVRGLNGAFVALARAGTGVACQLSLEPTRQTPDGSAYTLELRACRKCGQPYLFGYQFASGSQAVLRAFGQPNEQRGQPMWFSWEPPNPRSEDEKDEDDATDGDARKADFPVVAYAPATGAFRAVQGEAPGLEEIALWQIEAGAELSRCFACGGSRTITPVRADAEAAQAVVADAFYRCLPEAVVPPAPPEVLDYPGRGRKLLAFADSRQSAAYFAPYLENSNQEQRMRSLIFRGLRRAEEDVPLVGPKFLVNHMQSLGQEERLFPPSWDEGDQLASCRRALLAEFCLPFGRRQSLEALALVACGVKLDRRWTPPAELLTYLEPQEISGIVQVLLATVRLVKAVEIPPPLSPNDPAFRYQKGLHAVIAQGGEGAAGQYRLHGFTPEKAPHLQRRSGYLKRVLEEAARRRRLPPAPPESIRSLLDAVWKALIAAAQPVLRQVEVARGQVGHQLRWDDLWFRAKAEWYACPSCQQWSAFNVLNVCPSFRCTGRLEVASPDERLGDNHYRRTFSLREEGPIPLTAREHTAQLSPKLATAYQLAFQDGHHPDEGQVNVLSSSTTFELGVDLGDLEAVFLRNVPPSPANYQQRAGRAGRGIGSAAFAVTFAMPRSHDSHFFAQPPLMIEGMVRPPRIDLRNETIYLRHLNAVLLAEFVRDQATGGRSPLTTIGQLLTPGNGRPAPAEEFFGQLVPAVGRNGRTLDVLLPPGCPRDPVALASRVLDAFRQAREYYGDEVKMYDAAIAEVRDRLAQAEAANDRASAKRIYGFLAFLQDRLAALGNTDWVTFFSDRCVLPSYAFPIYNVTLATADPELSLERDLRIALSEYVPGAAIVAKGRLWRSIGIRKPWQKTLKSEHYACCPNCWHVMRHLEADEVFPDGVCPVCKHDGRSPPRRVHAYQVPEYGFTTDLTVQGEDLSFDRPERIPASRVLFVPQQEKDDPVRSSLGSGPLRVEVRTTEKADFFVFNDGDEPSGLGFRLCKFCGRQVELEGKKQPKVKPHKTPYGKDCPGKSYDLVHLGHDFISCAARLSFAGTNQPYNRRPFWLSLLYAVLGGMADALGVEANDVNGVIRPIDIAGGVAQEVVIFDDVPGGAGHALRLEDPEELHAVLRAAHARAAHCSCGETASCYTCLRSYRNQFCHDQLARGDVADYLGSLLDALDARPEDDQPYLLPDRARALRTAMREAGHLDVVTNRLTDSGPPEVGPWYIGLLEAAARPGTEVRLAVLASPAADRGNSPTLAPLLALAQAGARLYRARPDAPPPPYGLLALGAGGEPRPRSVAFHWGTQERTTALDANLVSRPLWFNRSPTRLGTVRTSMDDWFTRHAEPLTVRDLIEPTENTVVHAVVKDGPVDFKSIMRTVGSQRLLRCRLQDPYLMTPHQVSCLADFLGGVSWQSAGSSSMIPFDLVTQMSEGDPRERERLSFLKQQEEINKVLAGPRLLKPRVSCLPKKYNPLHMRYARFVLEGGDEVLYVFERGLDMKDPKTGNARSNSYVLEFRRIPSQLAAILPP